MKAFFLGQIEIHIGTFCKLQKFNMEIFLLKTYSTFIWFISSARESLSRHWQNGGSCLFHISVSCPSPFHLDLPTCSKVVFSQKKIEENLFSPEIKIVKGVFFSRICCKVFLYSPQKIWNCAKMLSFEEDFQDVYILAPLTQKSQSGAEFFSYFISIQFEAGLYLLAVATVTHIFLFNLFPFRIYKRFFPYGHNAKTDQRKQYCALAGLMFLLWKFLCFVIYHVTRFDEIFSYIKWWHADMFHCFCYLNCDIILVDLAGEICIKWNRTWIINSACFLLRYSSTDISVVSVWELLVLVLLFKWVENVGEADK